MKTMRKSNWRRKYRNRERKKYRKSKRRDFN